jgi:hypothetical protein
VGQLDTSSYGAISGDMEAFRDMSNGPTVSRAGARRSEQRAPRCPAHEHSMGTSRHVMPALEFGLLMF